MRRIHVARVLGVACESRSAGLVCGNVAAGAGPTRQSHVSAERRAYQLT